MPLGSTNNLNSINLSIYYILKVHVISTNEILIKLTTPMDWMGALWQKDVEL